MNAGHTTERVYDALKRKILGRDLRPGTRLDPASLSDELSSSVTPVRDALNLLTGQGLVEARTGDGFHVPQIDAPALQDLYDWSIEILALAIRNWPGELVPLEHSLLPPPATTAGAIFAQVGELSLNGEHTRAIVALNDRLHAARLCEQAIFTDGANEITAIAAALASRNRTQLRLLLTAYHRRRRRAAADIVRALYRAPTNAE